MIKVLLINPPRTLDDYKQDKRRGPDIFPPLGLLSITAYLKSKGQNVRVYDFENLRSDFKKFFLEFEPDVVGITCLTSRVPSVIAVCHDIKAICPGIPVIAGGHHPTCRPEDLLKKGVVDIVVRGEGGETFFELIQSIASGGSVDDIKGIFYLDSDGKLVRTQDRQLISDLDSLPFFPAEFMPFENFYTYPGKTFAALDSRRIAFLRMSRGCPFECDYCLLKSSYRARSPQSIINEVDHYFREYNIDSFYFMDETFTVDRSRVLELCDMLVKGGYHKELKWGAQTRVDCVDEDLLKKMRDAGCRHLSYGLESGVPRILNSVKKNITLPQIRKIIKMTKDLDIDILATFILGLPDETFWDSLRTIWFGLTLPIDRLIFVSAVPFPGTNLWDIAVKEGQIKDVVDWEAFICIPGFTRHDPQYIPKGRSVWELKFLQMLGFGLSKIKKIIFTVIRNFIP